MLKELITIKIMNHKKAILIIVFIVLSLLITPVYAILVGVSKFDELINSASIIVKGKVTRTENSPFEELGFDVEVMTVLTDDGIAIPKQLKLESNIGVWPYDLGVPFAKKQVVLLVLERKVEKISVVNSIGAILPAVDKKNIYDANSSSTRKVFKELNSVLAITKDQKAKGLVLVLLSQLGSNKDEEIFLPYAKSNDKWLHRAAIASLLRLNPANERITEAVEDFSNHLASDSRDNSADRLFWQMYKDVEWSSRCGSFGMEKEMTDRAKAYLPLYRILIDKAPTGYQRAYVSIEALKDVGERQDILRLYKYIDDERAWIRHEVLEGIGRILGLEIKRPVITSYMMPLPEGVDQWEKKSRSVVEQALKSERLIEK